MFASGEKTIRHSSTIRSTEEKNQFVSLLVGPLRDAFIKNKLISKLNLIMMTTTGGRMLAREKSFKAAGNVSPLAAFNYPRFFLVSHASASDPCGFPPIPIVEEKLMEIFCLNFAVVGGTR